GFHHRLLLKNSAEQDYILPVRGIASKAVQTTRHKNCSLLTLNIQHNFRYYRQVQSSPSEPEFLSHDVKKLELCYWHFDGRHYGSVRHHAASFSKHPQHPTDAGGADSTADAATAA